MAPLLQGEVEVVGRLPWSSNATFLARVVGVAGAEGPPEGTDGEQLVVYKPRRGERPLWDFPHGSLSDRELAAYEVSEASGWRIVPATVVREGPFGEGMVQHFVDHDPDEHYPELRDRDPERFRQFAAFDAVVNNADRKAGHCIRGPEGHVWGIDHGVTFHVEHKLRTVIWDDAGEALTPSVVDGLCRVTEALARGGGLDDRLSALLSPGEVEAVARRAQDLLDGGTFPLPRGDYPYPWPLV